MPLPEPCRLPSSSSSSSLHEGQRKRTEDEDEKENEEELDPARSLMDLDHIPVLQDLRLVHLLAIKARVSPQPRELHCFGQIAVYLAGQIDDGGAELDDKGFVQIGRLARFFGVNPYHRQQLPQALEKEIKTLAGARADEHSL